MGNPLLSADPRQVDAALRMQLADVAMASQMLLRRCENETDEKYLAVIQRAAMRATRILEQVELARKLEDEDELRAVFSTADLVTVCRELTEPAAELLEAVGIQLTFRTELDVLLTQVDEGLVERLLYELLSNAARAMTGGGQLSVTLLKRGKAAVITVGDEGAGLSEGSMERLFGDANDTPDLSPRAGAGLGLRLARTIAEIHGGLMIVETAPEAGMRVAVSLPLREERRNRLQSPFLPLDARERALVALSDVLPAEAFAPKKK